MKDTMNKAPTALRKSRVARRAGSLRGIVVLLGGVFVLAVGLGCGHVYWLQPMLAAAPAGTAPGTLTSTPFISPGIDQPPTRPALESGLDDGSMVIGIEVDGKARAYAASAMSSPTQHIVNDLVGEVPVTVTYCDRNNCARAFTADQRSHRLRIDLMGMVMGRMVLRTESGMYYQDSGASVNENGAPLPYAHFPVAVTTWKAWRDAHPDTDVYVGDEPP